MGNFASFAKIFLGSYFGKGIVFKGMLLLLARKIFFLFLIVSRSFSGLLHAKLIGIQVA
jgi:hypothetical protein